MPTRGSELLFINIFYFFALAPIQKPGVEFRYSTHYALKKTAESEEWSVSTLGFLWLCCTIIFGTQRAAALFY